MMQSIQQNVYKHTHYTLREGVLDLAKKETEKQTNNNQFCSVMMSTKQSLCSYNQEGCFKS